MPEGIAAKDFYGSTNFRSPALTPGKGRSSALKAIRSDPKRIFRGFPVQQQAFDFCDGRPGDRLHVWAVEKDNKGRRRFIAASYEGFWGLYSRFIRRGVSLHFYEVIRERHASKLYFDLEFQREANPDSSPEEMIDALIAACGKLSGIGAVARGAGIVELDSTTEKKFSRHLIFHNIVFHDNVQAGGFASNVVEFVAAKEPALMMVKNTAGAVTPFVDLGVYTKNRCFRLVGSSKFGKTQRLLSLEGLQKTRVSLSKHLFLQSLVCFVGSDATLLGSVCPLNNALSVGGACRGGRLAGANEAFEIRRMGEKSTFPLVDEYVYSIIGPHGGGIYGVTMLSSSDTIMYAIKGGYKYCANVGRHHKSNNVILIADLFKGEMYQKCFDPDCRGFRSPPWDLPHALCNKPSDGHLAYIDEGVNDDCLHNLVDQVEGKALQCSQVTDCTEYDGGVHDDDLNAVMDEFVANK